MQKTIKPAKAGFIVQFGWGAGIRTPECWYQKPEPYRLATPQLMALQIILNMAGVQGFEPRNAGIRNQSLTAWRHPKNLVATTGFEPVTPSL
jgi:hypothetical protein